MKVTTKLAAGLVASTALMSTAASAATISSVLGCDGGRDKSCYTIYVTGQIETKDDVRFNQEIERNKITRAVVVLNSPGGYFDPGIEIAYKIKEMGFTTYVPKETMCASTCAYMWLAGSTRYVQATAQIGFHAIYSKYAINGNGKGSNGKGSKGKKPQTIALSSGSGNALLGAYLARLGFSDKTIETLTSYEGSFNSTLWLTSYEQARDLGIEIKFVPVKT